MTGTYTSRWLHPDQNTSAEVDSDAHSYRWYAWLPHADTGFQDSDCGHAAQGKPTHDETRRHAVLRQVAGEFNVKVLWFGLHLRITKFNNSDHSTLRGSNSCLSL